MTSKKQSPYGSWKSPITSDLITSSAIGLDEIRLEGDNIYWSELRPTEGGRIVIMQRKADGTVVERTPAPYNARTRVHEYGGGSFVASEDTLYFSNFDDQALYRQVGDGAPAKFTHETGMRFADGLIDRRRERIICVREDHTDSRREAVSTIASVDLRTGASNVLVSGNDFYSTPRLSPDGNSLAWLTWHHPNMPWDGSELYVAKILENGELDAPELVAGGETESIFQPEWSPSGVLHFVSDRTGWWNLYRAAGKEIEPLFPTDAEFAFPQWILGMSTYAFSTDSRIVCSYTRDGVWHLAFLDTQTLQTRRVDTPYTDISGVRANSEFAVFRASSPTIPAAFVKLDLSTMDVTVLRRSKEHGIDPAYISEPQSIEFPTGNGLAAHAFYYPPKNPEFEAPEDERPPLIVKSHGGPTAATSSELNMRVQYWTSRGIGVVDVNYGGSTGYGRKYRERLNGNWGIVDVEDCVNAARYLVGRGEADKERLAITGGSAGGYTTLCALTFFDDFSAGSSHYGVSDLEVLTHDTHKFESRYLDSLIGPYPEQKSVYGERSPIHFTDRLSCPLIVFQGLEDKVVPPSQAEMIVDALREKGLPVAYVPFEGEQHGFRRSENIKRTLDAELDFYGRIFGFALAEPVEPVEIENLGTRADAGTGGPGAVKTR